MPLRCNLSRTDILSKCAASLPNLPESKSSARDCRPLYCTRGAAGNFNCSSCSKENRARTDACNSRSKRRRGCRAHFSFAAFFSGAGIPLFHGISDDDGNLEIGSRRRPAGAIHVGDYVECANPDGRSANGEWHAWRHAAPDHVREILCNCRLRYVRSGCCGNAGAIREAARESDRIHARCRREGEVGFGPRRNCRRRKSVAGGARSGSRNSMRARERLRAASRWGRSGPPTSRQIRCRSPDWSGAPKPNISATSRAILRIPTFHRPLPPSESAANAHTETGESCAVLLANLSLVRPKPVRDPTPEDYRKNGVQTAGTWMGSAQSLTYVSLRTGAVVSVTQTGAEQMDVTLTTARNTSMRYAGTIQSRSQVALLQ